MAKLISVNQHKIKLVDPGAGTGTLVASLCEVLLQQNRNIKKIVIDAYENDPNLLPLLEVVLQECLKEMNNLDCNVEYNIYEQDFILHNAIYFSSDLSDPWVIGKRHSYDIVISNPPYYKINKNSPHSIAMRKLIYGQPNIYALFMASATSLLRDGGEGVFVTPRSFCSGLYYKKFMEWFLNNTTIDHIHIFESRKDIFDSDGVLQENIILKITKSKTRKNSKISISVSRDKSFKDFRTFEVAPKDIIYHKNGDVFIRIPSSSFDVKILDIIDKWPNTLRDLGLEISTGPVVPFRAKKYLRRKFSGLGEVPLLWMHNIQGFDVIWPLRKNNKEESILVNEKTKSILLPVSNYVLLKRFSSKEQKRRLYAGVMLKMNFKQYEYIGIENHINYIYRPNGILSESEAFGIAAILNTTIVDRYFRILSGNTQVNATDIRNMPFPSIEEIRKIGEAVQKQNLRIEYELDNIVGRILGWDSELIKQLNDNEGCK
jgi:adenine-specific DNA-methyltransferase